jgi:hypothetical protein
MGLDFFSFSNNKIFLKKDFLSLTSFHGDVIIKSTIFYDGTSPAPVEKG